MPEGAGRAGVAAGRVPHVLVFDSGLGGVTVLSALAALRPDLRLTYLADNAAFPYGALDPERLTARVEAVLAAALDTLCPDVVVIACNTASTLVLPGLRARFTLPFVGTVPAIKPAAALSKSRRFAVLATPGTVRRDYTRDLITQFAADCDVVLVGNGDLAAFAEAEVSGEPVCDGAIACAIAPCFRQDETVRTDAVVLACTHFPLLLARFEALAPWPVAWIDPAPAIARRVDALLGGPIPSAPPHTRQIPALFTGKEPVRLRASSAIGRLGLAPDDALRHLKAVPRWA